jgi:hypothetical protein
VIGGLEKKVIENREKIEEKTGKHLTEKCECDRLSVYGVFGEYVTPP